MMDWKYKKIITFILHKLSIYKKYYTIFSSIQKMKWQKDIDTQMNNYEIQNNA